MSVAGYDARSGLLSRGETDYVSTLFAGFHPLRLKPLEHFGAFLRPIRRAVGPHVSTLGACEPPRNHGIEVFDMVVVASRTFRARGFAHPEGDHCGLVRDHQEPLEVYPIVVPPPAWRHPRPFRV